jgi:2-octaprenyl-6-methoxyphenol hydroxylase
MKHSVQFDVCVVGAGPVGQAAALCLAEYVERVALVGPPPAGRDNRTAALFASSVQLLRNLGLWQAGHEDGEPLRAIRIIDDMGRLLRAPEVVFRASEVDLASFGFNVPNGRLVETFRKLAAAHPGITTFESATLSRLELGPDSAQLRLSDDTQIAAGLVVGADGRNSLCRRSAGIGTRTWSYEQSALTCTFTHAREHGGVSTEFHRQAGPFTVVPSPGRSSSLVWVERPAIAKRLAGLDETSFRGTLEARLQGLLGSVGEIGPRAVFPLTGLTANEAGANRVALVGEAAHVIPPIGAQGLNLGLRDAAVLADCVRDALATGHPLGGCEMVSAYARARRTDIASRAWSIDLLNRSLISGFLPVQLLRGLGLHALNTVTPLRRLAIREGLSPSFVTPKLMRAPEASGAVSLDGPPVALASPQP